MGSELVCTNENASAQYAKLSSWWSRARQHELKHIYTDDEKLVLPGD